MPTNRTVAIGRSQHTAAGKRGATALSVFRLTLCGLVAAARVGAADWLVEVSDRVGLDFDDDLDIFPLQGHTLGPGGSVEDPPPTGRDHLYRNDLQIAPDGRRELRFTDVTAASGIEAERAGYGFGVATGDFDNDGRVDLYVTNWGNQRPVAQHRGGGFRRRLRGQRCRRQWLGDEHIVPRFRS